MPTYDEVVKATPGLQGYWRLDEASGTTALDSSPNARHGTYSGNYTLSQSGPIVSAPNGAVLFNGGAGDFVALPASVTLTVGSSVSVEYWIKVINVGMDAAFTIGDMSPPQRCMSHCPWNDSVLYWDYGGGRTTTNFAPYVGEWTHVVLVSDGTTDRIYLNGVEVASGYNGVPPTDILVGGRIGAAEGGTWAAEAYFDEFAFYNVVLTPAQVLEHYNAASTPSSGLDTGLWTAWGAVTQEQSGGTLNQSLTGVSGQYGGVISNSAYDFTNKTLQAQIAQLPSSAAGVQMVMRAEVDTNNAVIVSYTDGNLLCQHQISGTTTDVNVQPWPAGTIGLQIIFDNASGLVWFATADSNGTWTARFNETLPITTTALKISLFVGTYQAVASPGTAKWDGTGLPLAIYKNLTGTSAGTSTATGPILTRAKNLAVSATYPPTGSAAAVGMVSIQASRIAYPMHIRQAIPFELTGTVAAAWTTIPFTQPCAPGSGILAVVFMGAPGANVEVRKSGATSGATVLSQTAWGSQVGSSRWPIMYTGRLLTTAPTMHGTGLELWIKSSVGGVLGPIRGVLLEITGVAGSTANDWTSGLSVTSSNTSTQASVGPFSGTANSYLWMALVLDSATGSGRAFTNVATGPWTRLAAWTDGTTHPPGAVDIILDHSFVSQQSLTGLWNLASSSWWSAVGKTFLGKAPGLVGTATGKAWTPRLTSSGTPKVFTSTIIYGGTPEAKATLVGQPSARPINVVLLGLTDNFDSGTLNAQWTPALTAGAAYDLVGGTLNLTAAPNSPTFDDGSHIHSATTQNVNGKTIQAEITQRPNTAVDVRGMLRIKGTGAGVGWWEYGSRLGNLAVFEGSTNVANTTWPVGLRAIRIVIEAPDAAQTSVSDTAPRAYFQYTVDGVRWITTHYRSNGGSFKTSQLTAATVSFVEYTAGSIASPGTVKFDNVNVVPFPWVSYKSLTGSVSGRGTTTATILKYGRIDIEGATAAGGSTTTATIGRIRRREIIGATAGGSTCSAAITVERSFTAVSAGVSSVIAQLRTKQALVGISAGTSVEVGQPSVKRRLTVASAGVATTPTALINRKIRLVASTSAGVASVAVTLGFRGGRIQATINASSTATGQIAKRVLIAGTFSSAGRATTTASATRRRPLVAASAGRATTTVTIQRVRLLVVSSAGTATTASTIIHRKRALTSVSLANSMTVAVITRERAILAVANGKATVSTGDIDAIRVIQAFGSYGSATVFGRIVNKPVILWTGSTFALEGAHPVVLWEEDEFKLTGDADMVIWREPMDYFDKVPS